MGRVTYIALKQMKDGDKIIQPGDQVPQAAGWKSLRALLSARWLAAVTEVEVVNPVQDVPQQLKPDLPDGSPDESRKQNDREEGEDAGSSQQDGEKASAAKGAGVQEEKPEQHPKTKKEGK